MDKSIVPANQLPVCSSTCYEFSNPNGAVVVEIEDDNTSVGTVEKRMEKLKLNYQFDEKNVSHLFQSLMKAKMNRLKKIRFHFQDQFCTMKIDEIEIRLERSENGLSITYEHKKETIGCDDPEKSIVDHLWLVLRNPDLKLEEFRILSYRDSKAENCRKCDFEKLNTLLQLMIESIGHQIHNNVLNCEGFNEDIFLSMLRHVKPGTLNTVCFDISWKNERNYQKMEEIVETGQWKQAKQIFSLGVTPLKIDDLFHCEKFWLELASVTPEDVLRGLEHVSDSSCIRTFVLSCKNKKYDIDAIIDFLRSKNDGSRITKNKPANPQFEFECTIQKSVKIVVLVGDGNYIGINN